VRRACRVDDNHRPILAALRSLGAIVTDTSHVGDGFPDAFVLWRGKCLPVEIKDGSKPPSRRKLTPAQTVFHAEWARAGVPVTVLETEDDALKFLGARRAA
jgi:hypothetical protein